MADGIDMLRVGDAPPGSTPFYRAADGLHFDGQNGRRIDYGHTFDRARGYRVFFKFSDSNASNTWAPDSLVQWCTEMRPADAGQRHLKMVSGQLARQCVTMNREWERLGKPVGGIPTEPKGRA